MAWNDDHLNVIRDSYWRGRSAECPTCKRAVEAHDEPVYGTDQRAVVVGCPVCQERWSISPDTDKLSSNFRPWSVDEREWLLTGYGNHSLNCPVDGSALDTAIEPIGGAVVVGAKALVVRCGRCGQICSEPR